MYKRAIVDELGTVIFWCSDLTDEQIKNILIEYPECCVKCVEI